MPLLFTCKLGTTHSLATRLIRSTANFLEILMYCNTIVTHLLSKQGSTKELYTELHVYFFFISRISGSDCFDFPLA